MAGRTTSVDAPGGEVVLAARGIRKRSSRRRPPALDGVDLEIRAGTITGLVGPNGSGESTLIKGWAGFERPSAGTFSVLGRRCELGFAVVQATAAIIFIAANVLPLGAAAFLAAPLVAQEVETTTTTLSWTLARGRHAWYLPRAALVMLACVATALALGLLVDWTLGLLLPEFSPFGSLREVYQRGLLIPSRVAMTAAACLLAGAVLGRQVPALVAGIALAALIGGGIYGLDDSINRSNARRYDGDGISYEWITVDRRDGRVVSSEELDALGIYPGDEAFDSTYESVSLGIPDSDAPIVIWRNVAFHAGATVGLLVASAVVVNRRRPY